jgi:hypothetical protein
MKSMRHDNIMLLALEPAPRSLSLAMKRWSDPLNTIADKVACARRCKHSLCRGTEPPRLFARAADISCDLEHVGLRGPEGRSAKRLTSSTTLHWTAKSPTSFAFALRPTRLIQTSAAISGDASDGERSGTWFLGDAKARSKRISRMETH